MGVTSIPQPLTFSFARGEQEDFPSAKTTHAFLYNYFLGSPCERDMHRPLLSSSRFSSSRDKDKGIKSITAKKKSKLPSPLKSGHGESNEVTGGQ
jgi:hypothetical protein